jgi:hypothetical protein
MLCVSSVHAEKKDIVQLKNGDRITGEVKSLDRGELSFDTDHMGTLSIEWEAVAFARQAVLDREPEPLELTVLLGEGVVRDQVGGPRVMAEQLRHLTEMAQRPNVDVRLLGPGRAPSAINGFGLLVRPGDVAPFLVATLDVTGPNYEERAEIVAVFTRRFEHLLATAASPTETIRRIDDIRETLR